MGKYRFTIIIPHHNSLDLLRRCLDSIPDRPDLQIIVIDDNSSSEIVDFDALSSYTKSNTQIVLTKEGRGAGFARNIGLKYAQGEWLLFSDADDTFNTSVLNKALTDYYENDSDIIYFNANVINADTGGLSNNRLEIDSHMKSCLKSNAEWFRYKASYPWAKMIKRSLVVGHNIMFEEVMAGNDAMFSLQIGYYAKSILLVDLPIYNWMFRSNGNITSNISLDAALSKLGVAKRRNDFMEREGVAQYRNNLFQNHLFLLHKAGLSYPKAFMKIIHNTPGKYLLSDILSFSKFVISHKHID